METKWQLHCMNSFIDGVIINDFENDTEAAQYAANYEARCYRIDPAPPLPRSNRGNRPAGDSLLHTRGIFRARE